MFSLDRQATTPLTEQVEQGLRALMDSGRLPPGARLMSIRQLARQLGVSANTVVVAYDRLTAAGLIDARGTAGYFVCRPAGAADGPAALAAGEAQEGVWLVQQANDQPPGMLLASSGALPPAWLEDAVPVAALQRAMSRSVAGMASRCPPQGLPELREQLAQILRGQGMAVDAGRVLTTSGGTQAIDLICRSFLQPGDTVLVEDPGYFLMYDRLRRDGLRIVPVARTPEGLDLAQLEAACEVHRPRLLFMQTVLHNPTGWGSTPANLVKVLALAQRHGFLVAEDDVHGHFHPGHPTRLAALSGLDRVIYYSSFCKALSPALRMGYIAADPALLRPLMREKICAVLTGPALNELVLLEVLQAGRWRKHLDRLQSKLRSAHQAASRHLSGAGVRLNHPGEGGLFLWGQVPEGVDVDLLVNDAFQNDILLARGATFSASTQADQHLRFNVAVCQAPAVAQYLRSRFEACHQAQSVLDRMGHP